MIILHFLFKSELLWAIQANRVQEIFKKKKNKAVITSGGSWVLKQTRHTKFWSGDPLPRIMIITIAIIIAIIIIINH